MEHYLKQYISLIPFETHTSKLFSFFYHITVISSFCLQHGESKMNMFYLDYKIMYFILVGECCI